MQMMGSNIPSKFFHRSAVKRLKPVAIFEGIFLIAEGGTQH